MSRHSPIVMAIVWGALPVCAVGQAPADVDNEVTPLSEITVSSTRTSRRNDNIPSTVTVAHAEQIEQQGARDLKEMFSDQIDIAVVQQPARFNMGGRAVSGRAGTESINIRGLEGNRVLMMVDGIRVPNSFNFGPFATGRGDYLEVDGFSKVEVLRGPASTQFGSDGLGGAVSFLTLDPADVLIDGKTRAGFVRSGYAEVDRSWNNTVGAAASSGRWQGLILASDRQGHALANQGGNDAQNSTRTAPDPQNNRARYWLGKVVLQLDATEQLRLTLESRSRKQDTDVYSARAVAPLKSTSTVDLRAHDQLARERISLEHRFDDANAPWLQRARSSLYWQDSQAQQYTDELRYGAPERTRDNHYRQSEIGLSTQMESNLTGRVPQRLSYGLEWSLAKFLTLSSGMTPPPGATYPSKSFPDTRYVLGGVYAQNEIEFGALSLIPGLRLDHYALAPSSNGYQGNTVALSGQALTPRLGLVWRLDPRFLPYAQWATGYRAPTPDQVNNYHDGLGNPFYSYTSIGNPNLKPERANSIEIGVRGKISSARYALSAFDNRYRDFIYQQTVSGNGRPGTPAVFQYINLEQARIRGLELRGEWPWAARWTSSAGIAYARGDGTQNSMSAPLNTVMPLRALLGLRYEQGSWSARANIEHSAGKARDQIAPSAPPANPQFASPAYTVLDLGARWKPARAVTLNAELNNVFNYKYWRWSDVRGVENNSPVLDAFTAPGRNARLSVRYDF